MCVCFVIMQLPSELDVKWKIYRCHVLLRQHQEALDTVSTVLTLCVCVCVCVCVCHLSSFISQLSSISLRLRNVQVAIALGNLYKNFKNDR